MRIWFLTLVALTTKLLEQLLAGELFEQITSFCCSGNVMSQNSPHLRLARFSGWFGSAARGGEMFKDHRWWQDHPFWIWFWRCHINVNKVTWVFQPDGECWERGHFKTKYLNLKNRYLQNTSFENVGHFLTKLSMNEVNQWICPKNKEKGKVNYQYEIHWRGNVRN